MQRIQHCGFLPTRFLWRDHNPDGATGDVLEIAAGTGRNLRHYPPDVRLTATELSAAMLDLARRQAAAVGRDAELRVGDAQALDFPGESFDTVVCTLALCTIPDPRRAVGEVRRVLRPGVASWRLSPSA